MNSSETKDHLYTTHDIGKICKNQEMSLAENMKRIESNPDPEQHTAHAVHSTCSDTWLSPRLRLHSCGLHLKWYSNKITSLS